MKLNGESRNKPSPKTTTWDINNLTSHEFRTRDLVVGQNLPITINRLIQMSRTQITIRTKD